MAPMASVPTVEPWSALLEAGREDERLVREAFEGARAAHVEPFPDDLHPARARILGALGVGSSPNATRAA